MLETVKMQKKIRADKETIWTELLKADFTKDFLPEIKSTKGNVLPSYSIPYKLLSWHSIGKTSIEMAKSDLGTIITSIDLELEQLDNKTIVKFEVNLDNKLGLTSITRYRAIHALFEVKLAILKKELEQNQADWSPAFS